MVKERVIWFDPDEWPDAAGVLIHGGTARDAGVEVCFSPAADCETGLARQLAGRGLRLIRPGEAVEIPWYALPRLYVFARDDEGFYATDEPPAMDGAAAVWHVDSENRVTRAADSIAALIRAFLSGKAPGREPDETHRLFASWRAAEAAGELFLRNDTPWKRGKR